MCVKLLCMHVIKSFDVQACCTCIMHVSRQVLMHIIISVDMVIITVITITITIKTVIAGAVIVGRSNLSLRCDTMFLIPL